MAAMSGWRAMALAGVVALGATGGSQAQQTVGNWVVQHAPDRFGDGGTDIAITGDGTMAFAIRCIRREWSLALMDVSADPKPLQVSDTFYLLLKVDKYDAKAALGRSISPRLIQIETTPVMVSSLLGGETLAVRVNDPAHVVSEFSFPLKGARRALSQHMKNCPGVE